MKTVLLKTLVAAAAILGAIQFARWLDRHAYDPSNLTGRIEALESWRMEIDARLRRMADRHPLHGSWAPLQARPSAVRQPAVAPVDATAEPAVELTAEELAAYLEAAESTEALLREMELEIDAARAGVLRP